ncbi:spore germination protein [Paenibacillus sacheonensis]|uniref:Spore gernimation protein GerA n=1 Tax=Paenibacillus sacheonensis TaxID=742054 RepID=A0A7X4YPP1_9BACL|nr:spore germination protein [Paenibacillus sacheonensis]MBM7564962.1 hypothetical protein [Paenibacillus sacheonensis]NBC70250.1 spore gernimation protein GerA [Paenibacillus sacheonensis]
MNQQIQKLRDQFSENDDFFMLQDSFLGTPVVLLGLKSLIDVVPMKLSLQTYHAAAIESHITLDAFKKVLGEADEAVGAHEIYGSILNGKLFIYFEADDSFVIMDPIPRALNRSIETPINENVMQGSQSAFTEDIATNVGLVRKQLQSDHLRVHTHTIGTEEAKDVALVYYEGRADMDFIRRIERQFAQNKNKTIENLQQFSKEILGFPTWSMVSKFNQTELPQEAAHSLRKGRVLLFVDRLPLALVTPGMLWDAFCLDSDRNFPLPLMLFLRTVRVLGALATLILPGLYVALVSVNPEVLRIEMALSIAQTRAGVPYPAIIEIIFMFVVIELTIEASFRLPKTIGPTITMVGGIILGQAAVQAKLVSNLLIIILAATTIANSTIIGLQQSLALRISKYVVVVLASMFGVLGILEGMLLICGYLGSLTAYGIPFVGFPNAKSEANRG